MKRLALVGYGEDLQIGGRPCSAWWPWNGADAKPLGSYRYIFSVRKLFGYVVGLPFGSKQEFRLPCNPQLLEGTTAEMQVGPKAVILVHGLLCTRFDLAHLAERFAEEGFTVLAPEMEDSVGYEEGISPGGFVGALLQRQEVEARRCQQVEEALAWLKERGATSIGLVGHSRGGITVCQLSGDYCRVNLAGLQPPQADPTGSQTFSADTCASPVFFSCGVEDEVCARPPLSMDYVLALVERLLPNAETWYPADAGHFAHVDPRAATSWQASLPSWLSWLSPAPASTALAADTVQRVSKFLRRHLG